MSATGWAGRDPRPRDPGARSPPQPQPQARPAPFFGDTPGRAEGWACGGLLLPSERLGTNTGKSCRPDRLGRRARAVYGLRFRVCGLRGPWRPRARRRAWGSREPGAARAFARTWCCCPQAEHSARSRAGSVSPGREARRPRAGADPLVGVDLVRADFFSTLAFRQKLVSSDLSCLFPPVKNKTNKKKTTK